MDLAELLSLARRVLERYALCNSCLGRLFGMLGYGLSNAERGRAIKVLLAMGAYDTARGSPDVELLENLARTGFRPALDTLSKLGLPAPEQSACHFCDSIMDRLDELSAKCVEAGREYEYRSFQVGCSLDRSLIKREEELWLQLGLTTFESLKSEVTREVGKRIQLSTGKAYSATKPDILFIVNLKDMSVTVHARPIFIYGRYRKLVSGLPQSPWARPPDPLVAYQASVEELITAPLVEMARASGAKLHAAGREDPDVRTLGNGRPFMVEIKNPKLRSIDFKRAQEEINRRAQGLVEVEGLASIDGKAVPKLKAYAEIARKTYVARMRISREVSEEELRDLERALKGVIVHQRTPLRVLRRRIDRVRRKVVYDVRAKLVDKNVIEITVTCQGGLYVKEFIHGDEGRTKPSVAEVLGASVEVEELDVVWIEEPAVIKDFLL